MTSVILLLLLTIILIPLNTLNADSGQDTTASDHLIAARQDLAARSLRSAWDHIKAVLTADSTNREALYLKGEACLLYGKRDVNSIIEQLYRLGDTISADILHLKRLLFLGDSHFPAESSRMLSTYPHSGEVKLASWLHSMDRSGLPPDTATLREIATEIVMEFVPYQAAYTIAADRTEQEALDYLDLFLPYASDYYRRERKKIETRMKLRPTVAIDGAFELEYAQCGAQAGMYLYDSKGKKIKMSLDTGSGGRLFTIHHVDIGDMLYGDTVLLLEDGIWYNYMDSAADIVTKAVDLSRPPITNLPVEYFDGGFSIADGCFSPFAFPDVAIMMDVPNQRVVIRDSIAHYEWRDSLDAESFTEVPVILRNSWPYIPCTINGHEALMMVETGSRDVNLNELAAEYYNVSTYDSALIWRGEEYPTTMFDLTISVGGFDYDVKGGLVTEHVVGNHAYGLGAAGDIGPDFFNHFAYAFDPWQRRLVLVRSKNKNTEGS